MPSDAKTNRAKYTERLKDADGNFYRLFRPRGHGGGKSVRLPDDINSKEYAALYDPLRAAIDAGFEPKRRGRPAPVVTAAAAAAKLVSVTPDNRIDYHAPSAGWLIGRYLASKKFRDPNGHDDKAGGNSKKQKRRDKPFAPMTQYNYRQALDIMRERIGQVDFVEFAVPKRVKLYVAKIADEFTDSTAGLHRQLISNLWDFADNNCHEIDFGDRGNPVYSIDNPYEVEGDGHEPWPDDVQDTFIDGARQELIDAYWVLLCTGQRVCDVVTMTDADYDTFKKTIKCVQQKTGTKVEIEAADELIDVIERAKKRGASHILTHKWGRSWGTQSLSKRIKERLIEIGCGEYTTHGLRKNAGILLAEMGCSAEVIKSVTGHKSDRMVNWYIKMANKGKLQKLAGTAMRDALAQLRIERAARTKHRAAERRAKLKVVS